MKAITLSLITGYQLFLSPVITQLFGTLCRYPQTCSAYAKEVISQYGIRKGSMMALNRIAHCQPFVNSYEHI